MDIPALQASPVGQLVPIKIPDIARGSVDYHAFLPEPLPPQPDLSPATWTEVAEATEALGMLKQACIQLPNPALLIAPALAREAVDTSALEGTFAPLSEVLEARLPHERPSSPEVAEVRAYERIAHEGFRWVEDHPITIGLLCEMHAILSEDSMKPMKDPGRVREHQVLIGPEGCTAEEARFIPPPGDDRLRTALESWQAWIEAEHAIPPVVQAALAHYQFETVHPFGDGNGRIGRLLIVLQLMRLGALSAPVLTVSPWLLRNRRAYQDGLLQVSVSGDWNPWVSLFCRAVREQAIAHVGVVGRLTDWSTDTRQRINDRGWSGTIVRVADSLIEWPVITMRWVADTYGVSPPTAKGVVDRLVDIGVLTELTGRSYGMIFGAHGVIEIVESL